ncbi:type II toxin-antitoxin system death-on-curing family toxin [[Mannheimia] succiniciproducens]|uniref:Fido domain-containing protein n=1 Tax=Mannheimia succiniciproducens (strain KCTC 0769BP / MBEL55E) TaxID=221988 RepID=Q65QI6_MANSM|nr:Fic family protein [[Mannheimia] succiniciproducens]AAU38774.1 unknown [[Mannheimia] succiniciproducens MBEL55E]
MNVPILYFDVVHSIQIHDWIIEKSGGLAGLYPDGTGKLESVLEHIQNDLYYPNFEDKLVHLIYSINKLHAFLDGNKRSSIVLGSYFLELNGYDYCVKEFTIKMENIVVWLAESKISKELLLKLVCSILNNEEQYSDELKYELICATSDDFGN